LVAIDVNSGKNTSERNIESTALKTNMEAANEIARQLRLRDLGGLVVIDFIDMDDYRNNFKVEKTIKSALYRDRARIQVGRISMFGLLELSRQRLRSSLIDKTFDQCNYCNGSGLILNSNAIGDQIIKVIKEKISKDQNINVKCNTSLAETLINNKNKEIANLENTYKSKITFVFDNQFSLHEPLVQLENKIIPLKVKDAEKKGVKKKIIKKRTKTKKKVASKKTVIEDSDKKEKIQDKDLKTSKKLNKEINEIKNSQNENSKTEEKTGWWS